MFLLVILIVVDPYTTINDLIMLIYNHRHHRMKTFKVCVGGQTPVPGRVCPKKGLENRILGWGVASKTEVVLVGDVQT